LNLILCSNSCNVYIISYYITLSKLHRPIMVRFYDLWEKSMCKNLGCYLLVSIE